MAVPLPPISGGSVLPEYAATAISFNRSVKTVDGAIVALFTSNLSYQRTDYLLNADGSKVGIVQTEIGGMPPQEYFGNIFLNADETAALFITVPDAGKPIGLVIADMADALIHDDLVKRGILEAN